MIKGKLKVADNEGLASFWCPGCKEFHSVTLKPVNPNGWDFDFNYDKPTFAPSVLVTGGHYVAGYENTPGGKLGQCWCNFKERYPNKGEPVFHCIHCHSFVKDGKIQYLNDCNHELAGQTVDMVAPPEDKI